ncbi:MAG: SurA N-terminal domain-containing protein [Anaerolineae bacterium]|nr:SurA N-terminal domain-containing protein [Thermoflexales bacterium]MDW8394631.1 SurA N-terminal domain-containing protein [Anaerolineae bacterium]
MFKRPPTAPKPQDKFTRLQMTRYEREQYARRLVIIGSAATGIITLLLILAAALQLLVFEPQRAVAVVDGTPITVQELQKRMRYVQFQALNRYQQLSNEMQQLRTSGDESSTGFLMQFYQQQLQRLQNEVTAESVATEALNDLIEERLIQREAERRGIQVTDAEVQESLERDFGFFRKTLTPFPTATPFTPEPTPTGAALAFTPTAAAPPTPSGAALTPTPTALAQPTPTSAALTLTPTAVAQPTPTGATPTLTSTAPAQPTPTSAALTLTPTAPAQLTPTGAVPALIATAQPTPTSAAPASTLPAPTAVVTATPTPFPTPTPRLQPTSITEAEFQQLYQQALEGYSALGFGDADIRALIRASLYRQRVQKAFADETPTRAMHYRFDYVRFNERSNADRAVQRLNNGEITFEALISETNAITQPAPIGTGVTLGDWISQRNVTRQYGEPVLTALSSGEVGKPSAVVESNGSFYVLLLKGREERALSEFDLQDEQRQRFDEWLNRARGDSARVQRLAEPREFIPSDVRTRAQNFLRQVGVN